MAVDEVFAELARRHREEQEAQAASTKRIVIPPAFADIIKPARYKIYYGGRGGAKSESFARVLIAYAASRPIRILCTREYQNSIKDSVHKLVCDAIESLGLAHMFHITENSIKSLCGSEFIFKGLRHDIDGIKSLQGVDICWCEEAQHLTKASLEILPPTIRKAGSELWFSLNLDQAESPIHQLIVNPPPGAIVRKVNYDENPYFTPELEYERQASLALIANAKDDSELAQARADYDHIWLGEPRRQAMAGVIRRWEVKDFEAQVGEQLYFGMDFGFAVDPTALVRMFIREDCLYIEYEAYGYGTEIDDLPALMKTVPGANAWPIKADCARPETISYLSRQGFNIMPSLKWQGSVEDGIAHLNGFRRIYIHPRCRYTATEARMYQYKVDRVTKEILPVIVDKHNHLFDAARYALAEYVTRRGGLSVWAKLGQPN